MTIFAALISLLSSLVVDLTPMAEYHMECYQIGDGMYNCDGGRL